MSSGRIWAIVVGCVLVGLSAGTMAQEMTQPEVENSRYQFAGEVTGNDVYVRSGPGEGYYPTQKLNRGAQVTVVGIKFGWLKILPPEGSFSYIPKAWVERSGDGTVGRVTKPDSPVRAGSTLNELKSAVQTGLNENDRVVILGEKDEYFTIQPPAGAYLYVFKDFVRPVKQVDATGTDTDNGEILTEGTTTTGTIERVMGSGNLGEGASDTSDDEDTSADTDGHAVSDNRPTTVPTSQVTDAVAQAESAFSQLEAQFRQVSEDPIDQQPVEELLSGYEPLASGDKLPESMRRIAAYRVAILRERAKAKEALLALKQDQAQFEQRQRAAVAEREELAQRITQSEVRIYAAVGELRPSSLQHGKEMLFRLTDPSNGRTVVYVRSNDPEYGNLIGKFVGVKGTVSQDTTLNIQVITPTGVTEEEPSEVNHKVAAQIVPPSMAGR